MFDKILIANRGEIACRVAATARRLGVRTVAIHSDTDASARHLAACDEAVGLGGLTATDSYLRQDAIIAAAKRTGAAAIHPGYGFLSENAEFAASCRAAGIAFIGPSSEALALMGSKAQAKALMAAAGVPLLPGYHGEDTSPQRLRDEAARIGYPVMIKASAGGGGRGMRRVDRPEDFQPALEACRREASAAFGDDRMLIERCLPRPRHIEIQIFGDLHGAVLHLFERDCSVQRRHQKILEESPAPGLAADVRAAMGAAAVAAARAVQYAGAGTVEFITEWPADGGPRFYFMEMNTRLQVEHPVTEAVTGLDLVEWQLRVASGEALPCRQSELVQRGHAIEARICAENPDAGFLPASGVLRVLRWPEHCAFHPAAEPHPAAGGPRVRIDSGFGEGDRISPHYDSMIAKLIVWGADREQALRRLSFALAEVRIAGLASNVDFLRRVLASRAFATGDLDTALIEREHATLFESGSPPPHWAIAALIARVLDQEAGLQDADPWSRRDGWRLHGRARRSIDLALGSGAWRATLDRARDGALRLQVAECGARATQEWRALACHALGGERYSVALDGERRVLDVHLEGRHAEVWLAEGRVELRLLDVLDRAGHEPPGAGSLDAAMPGRILAVLVSAGDAIQRDQALVVLEAMKMEHTVRAPRDGTVAEILCQAGEQVAAGVPLLRLREV